MEIKVLGKGCKKCGLLEKHTKEALEILGIDATIEKVTDINAIADYGVLATPALVVDGEVKLVGKILPPKRIAELLK
ncbi:MAG: thioredoxin family protein [Candidatus Izemoplasmataceae bacterium]|jgi:small redox-active disulfide protein 2|uniref:thioredoxin family protein n=1 Tax=Liberiplasma polymorphum TaxID=3374570 RepID=UPI0037711050